MVRALGSAGAGGGFTEERHSAGGELQQLLAADQGVKSGGGAAGEYRGEERGAILPLQWAFPVAVEVHYRETIPSGMNAEHRQHKVPAIGPGPDEETVEWLVRLTRPQLGPQ